MFKPLYFIAVLSMSVLLVACGPSEQELELQKQNKTLQYERDATKHELDAMTVRLEDMVSKFQSAEQQITELESSLKELQKLRDAADTAQNTILRLESELAAIQDEIVQHKQASEDLQTRFTEFQETAVPKTEALSKVAETKAQAEKEGKKLADRLAAATESKKQLQESHSRLKAQHEALTTKHAALESEKNKLEAALDEAQKRLGDYQQERDQLSQKVSLTAEQLADIRSRAAQLNSSYKTMLSEHSQLEKNDAEKRKQLDELRVTLEQAQTEVARLTGARGIYTIQSGDTLSSIAAFFYRDGNQWVNIWKANQYMLKTSDLIYEGMVLIVPQIDQAVTQ